MTILSEAIKALTSNPDVYAVKDWQGKRTYVQVRGQNRAFNGDKSWSLYVDNSTGELCCQQGKGTTSRAFAEAFERIIGCYPGAVQDQIKSPLMTAPSFVR